MILAILAGGRGARLKPLTNYTPKPMIKINNIPFLEYLIKIYSKYNLEKIYLLTGYKKKNIKKKFHKKYFNGVKVICIEEDKKMGTGGALYKLKNKIKKDFFLINGDTYLDVNLNNFYKKKIKPDLQIWVSKKNSSKDNNLNINRKKIIYYENKGPYVSAGLYFLKAKILKDIKYKYSSLEEDILKPLINKKKVNGEIIKNKFIDIGTHKNLKLIKKELSKSKKGIFLDRDGVINEDHGYTHKIKEFKFKKNIINYLLSLSKNYHFFIVTNQAGIAHGKFRLNEMLKFYNYIKYKLSENDILIDDMRFCPHHPNAKILKFKKKCKNRKPNNGMLLSIIKFWNIDIKKSFMIGDKISDQKAADKTNMKYFYYSDLILKKKYL